MKEKKGETLSMTKPGSPNAALKFALRTVLEDCSLMCGESDGRLFFCAFFTMVVNQCEKQHV